MHKFYISLLFSLTTYLLTAQNAGQLSGRILDEQTQLPIEGVTLILEGSTMGVVTDEGGYFNFKDVPSQSYNLIVSHLG